MTISVKRIGQLILSLSLIIVLFLFWWIYGFSGHQGPTSAWMSQLPLANAVFNGLSAICLCFGIVAIKQNKPNFHRNWMLGALGFSALFLISYLLHHYVNGDILFAGPQWLKGLYFFILISHIILTLAALPLILFTFSMAFLTQFSIHKKVARITFPIWLYVSVTGILIYVLRLV